jgi:hypothetical protein
MLESLLRQQKSELEDLRKTVRCMKSQEFQRKAKYEETSSAPSLTSSDESDNEVGEINSLLIIIISANCFLFSE